MVITDTGTAIVSMDTSLSFLGGNLLQDFIVKYWPIMFRSGRLSTEIQWLTEM